MYEINKTWNIGEVMNVIIEVEGDDPNEKYVTRWKWIEGIEED